MTTTSSGAQLLTTSSERDVSGSALVAELVEHDFWLQDADLTHAAVSDVLLGRRDSEA